MPHGIDARGILGMWVVCFTGVVLAIAMAANSPGLAAAVGAQAGSEEVGRVAGPERCELWVDVLVGEPAEYTGVLADLAGARAVYLGERHGVDRHHQWQARIAEDLAKRDVPLVLGLEQLEAHYQPAVDRYNRGEISFEELARATNWAHRWPTYRNYRPAVEAARKAGAPILALNARLETVRAVSRGGGVSKLSPEVRAELPAEMQLDDPAYERLLRPMLGVHQAATPERLRPMVEAQIVRDETMAETLASFLKSEQGKGRTAVVLTGAGHVSYGLGLPERVRRRIEGLQDRIVVFSESGDVKLTPEMEAAARETPTGHQDLRAIGRPIADYLSVAGRCDDRPSP